MTKREETNRAWAEDRCQNASRGILNLGVLVVVALVMGAGCGDKGDSAEEGDSGEYYSVEYTEERQPCSANNPNRNLYFGDLHVHTELSWDAYGYDVRTTPSMAYGFARGGEVLLPPLDAQGTGTRKAALERPLDFVALTDHLEFLGEVRLCTTPASTAYSDTICENFRKGGEDEVAIFGTELTRDPPTRFEDICQGSGDACREAASEVWTAVVQAAEDAYDTSAACSFTSFAGYEYTGSPKISNNHRNVIFRNAQVPNPPPSYFEEPVEQHLWQALDEACISDNSGCDFIAIPHNSNWSNGNLFFLDYSEEAKSEKEERSAAAFRGEMEPLAEIHQHKGDMECKNGFAGIPEDPLCDFEKIHGTNLDFEDCGEDTGFFGVAGGGCISRYDFVRNVLKLGLAEEDRIGVNPYKMGVIGSTDTHNGTPGHAEEHLFPGHVGLSDHTPEIRMGPGTITHNPKSYNPGGLTAVWALENSRDALFQAFRRREVFSTSGTRISVRFFGGWDYPTTLCDSGDLISLGYTNGVPMGRELRSRPEGNPAPIFVVQAKKDPGVEGRPGADLQRVQIIKGWLDDSGETQEKVFEVEGATDNDAGVDLATCERTGEGLETICAVWTDPEFDPDVLAFYYARVLENPSCRWAQYDCNSFAAGDPATPQACLDDAVAKTVQERAITSAIWYAKN